MRIRRGPAGLAVLAAATVAGTAACARQSAPPGGPPDARPPVVIATTPEALADVLDFDGPVRFEFNERISEQTAGGTLDEVVVVSPRTGDVRVDQGRRSLSIEIDGGFQQGVVYRVTLLPGVRDMFGNQIRDPFELVFTTGADADPTTVAGEIWDRTTGTPLAGVAVQAVGPDSLSYVGVSDSEGIYALRYLPPGPYELRAFEDRNRDDELGPNEPRGRAAFALETGDTAFVDVPVLPPDTTPAVLETVEALDSVTVALRFDDYVDPEAPLEEVDVQLRNDSVDAPAVSRIFHEPGYTAFVDAVTDSLARLDSLARAEAADTIAPPPAPEDTVPAVDTLVVVDSVAADTVMAPDTGQAAEPAPPPGPPRLEPLQGAAPTPRTRSGRTLPGRRIVLRLDAPLPRGIAFEVVVGGMVNINGLEGGGGAGTVVLPVPEDPPGDSLPGGVGLAGREDALPRGGATSNPSGEGSPR